MIKKLSITFGCLLLMAGLSFGQTASFSFNDNNGTPDAGTYNPTATVAIDVFGTFTTGGGTLADGFSLWLEAPTLNGFSSAINITSGAQVNWTDATHPTYPKTFTDASGATAGFLTDHDQFGTLTGDLGATSTGGVNDFTGTRLLATYTFSLTNAPAGTYTIFTVANNPKKSGINDNAFAYFNAPRVGYTFTIVPEPSTWSLVGVGALGAVGFGILRRRQRA